MKVRIWNAITDGGDGEHHSHQYPSKEAMIEDLSLTDIQGESEGTAFDEYDSPVQFSTSIFDTAGYEVVP